MAVHRLDAVIQTLRNTTHPDVDSSSDGQLLNQFITHRSDLAFATLLRRHGPMVWGVCRRIVSHHQDAEDAFQAAFLVLARKAASIRPREMVAGWLFGVAQRTALKARALAGKRQARESLVSSMPEVAVEQRAGDNLEMLIACEIANLPDIYRLAFVLCDIEGQKGKDVARQLKIPQGTLSTRLRTARMMLAKRLARHGVLPAAALAAWCSQNSAHAIVPVDAPAKVISMIAGNNIPSNVLALTEGVLHSMALTKFKNLVAALLVLGTIVLGGVLSGYAASEQEPIPEQPPAQAPELPPPGKKQIEKPQDGFARYTIPVADLVIPIAGLDDKGNKQTKEAWLIDKITHSVSPSSWEENGGKGTIRYFPMGRALVIRTTPQVQRQVTRLLESMRRFQYVQIASEVRLLSFTGPAFGKMQNLVPQLKKDGPVILNAAEVYALLHKTQDDASTIVTQAPKVTLFLGQAADLGIDFIEEKKATISLTAYVAANLLHVDLNVKIAVNKVEFEARQRLEDGATMAFFKRDGNRYLMVLVTPRVIIAEDEETVFAPNIADK